MVPMKDRFLETTAGACEDPALGRKLDAATARQRAAREAVCEELGDVDAFRELAAGLRDKTLSRLDEVLSRFTERAERAGVRVHWADKAADACGIIRGIAREHGVERVVKSKSMVTEEINLTPHLEREGLEVTETDLGEFIIQLAAERPSHIVLPAIHMSAAEVDRLFREKIAYAGEPGAEALTKAARRHLRGKFRDAQMGVSGVNFAAADQGMWIVCTNEGNGRYVMTLPRVYVAVMGIERIVENMEAAAVLLKLLARFATGQRITQYVNIAGGPCGADGPEHVHLVLLDNGRSDILGTRYWPMLRCIRCGACLNACPVFRHVGGQTFPGPYSGPMGSVLLPLMLGLARAGSLPKASSLCSACANVCPVKIPLPDLLLELRSDLAKAGRGGFAERMGMSAAAWTMRHPLAYRTAKKLLRLALLPLSRNGWVKRMPSWPGQWTRVKDLPLPARKSYLSERRAREAPPEKEPIDD
jgi:L-lactate dehydrogenase complex protein LldF